MPHPSHFLCFRFPDVRNVGRHQPAEDGCVLRVIGDGRIRIEGPSEEDVLAHARAFLKRKARENACSQSIEAVLIHPGGRVEIPLHVPRDRRAA